MFARWGIYCPVKGVAGLFAVMLSPTTGCSAASSCCYTRAKALVLFAGCPVSLRVQYYGIYVTVYSMLSEGRKQS